MDYRLEQFRFELREDPSSRSFFKLGECLRREDELDEAVQTLRAGLKLHPGYIAAWVSLGRALLAGGKNIGAAEALARFAPGHARELLEQIITDLRAHADRQVESYSRI